MAYNGYPTPYPQPYYQQYQPQVSMTQQNQNNGLVWVQGEAGAKSFFVPANGTAMLMDSEADQFFIKSADASGMPLPLRTFRYTEVTNSDATKATMATGSKEEYVTKSEFSKFKHDIESMLRKDEENE